MLVNCQKFSEVCHFAPHQFSPVAEMFFFGVGFGSGGRRSVSGILQGLSVLLHDLPRVPLLPHDLLFLKHEQVRFVSVKAERHPPSRDTVT